MSLQVAALRDHPRICLSVTIALCLVVSIIGRSETTVRVGVYDNPPKVAIASDGTVSGLYPELVEAIAEEKDWRLVYVPGSWTESLERLERGEIDLMVDVAVTEPRKGLYAFNEETVLVNWGIVYARADVDVVSLIDLDGLRIAVMHGSTHTDDPGGIVDLLDRFGIDATILERESYDEVFQALQEGTADVGVVNRVFGLIFEEEYDVVRTPIVFNPIELRFALPLDGALTPILSDDIDAVLSRMKADPQSVYYQAIGRHLLAGSVPETVFRWPPWMLPAAAAALAVIAALSAAIVMIRRQVVRRIRAEEALRRSEERFALAMEGANDGLWDWDLLSGRVYYSPRWADMLGYRPEDLEPSIEAFRRLVHPDDRATVTNAEQGYFSGESDRYEAEFRMKHKDGSDIDVLSRATLIRRSSDNAPIRVVGTHVDISDRKRAERSLAEREAYLRTIIEHMPVDFFALDADGRYIMQSPISQDVIGDALGKRTDELNVPDSLKRTWNDELQRVLAGETERHEYDVPSASGDVRTVLSRMAPVEVAGEIVAAVGMTVDITDRKRVEEALADAKELAEEADRMKSAFLATMSHELRTPLNSIIGFTGILLQGLAGALNDEQKKQMTMVKHSAGHLLDLINDVLDISKIEAGQLDVFPEPFDLDELLRSVVETAMPLAEAKGIALRLEAETTVGEMVSDRRRVKQILTNLLSNAVKFTSEGGVTLRCIPEAEIVTMEVEDTGIGIAPDDVDKLFVPFQQIDSGLTRAYEGTGLGLSICRRLVEKLGGTIKVESQPERGSRFMVTLPRNGREASRG